VLPPNASMKMRARSSAGSLNSGEFCSLSVEIALLEAGDSWRFNSLGGLLRWRISRFDILLLC
jgi:hypothetical protein